MSGSKSSMAIEGMSALATSSSESKEDSASSLLLEDESESDETVGLLLYFVRSSTFNTVVKADAFIPKSELVLGTEQHQRFLL